MRGGAAWAGLSAALLVTLGLACGDDTSGGTGGSAGTQGAGGSGGLGGSSGDAGAGAGGSGGLGGGGAGPCASDAACASEKGAGSLCVADACPVSSASRTKAMLVVVPNGACADELDADVDGARFYRALVPALASAVANAGATTPVVAYAAVSRGRPRCPRGRS